jgi:hypothetical protein
VANYRFLLDNDVRHLLACFPSKQVLQLEDVGLDASADDRSIVSAASSNGLIVVTNNRRDFEKAVNERISASRKKKGGCTRVDGLVVILPSDRILQERALSRAASQMAFEGRPITWKEVNEQCLKVIVEESGNVRVSRLPRCPHCDFGQE